MGKRSAATTDSHQNGCNGDGNGGVSNKKMKYNNGQDHHNHQKQQQQNLHYNSPLGSLGYHLIKDNTELTPNNTSLLLATSNIDKESPKPEFQLSRELVNGTILTDLMKKQWRIGNPIGKGSFGEIFLASDNISIPVTNENAKYVAKIEPHSNGPLFVEIHCLLNTAKPSVDNPLPPGMPAYIASGSHYFRNTRYRFLILQRFDRDLHSIIKNRKVDQKSVLILAVQILEVLEHLHDKGYCHSDIKAENLMISKCTYNKNHMLSSSTTLSNNGGNLKIILKKKMYNNNSINNYNNKNNKINLNYNNQIYKNNNVNDNSNSNNNMKSTTSSKKNEHDKNNHRKDEEDSNDDDDDDDNDNNDVDDDYDIPKHFRKSTSNNNCTGTGTGSGPGPTAGSSSNKKRIYVPYSGSNPVRSCRITNKQNSSTTYQEMVLTHYLRPTKKINYSQFFGDDTSKSSGDDDFTLDEYITHHRQRLNKKYNDSDLNDFLYNSNSNSSCSNNDSIDSTSNNHCSSKGTNNNSNNHNGNSKGRNNHQKQNNQQKRRRQQQQKQEEEEENEQKFKNNDDWITEDRIFLIDFGLASKFMDSNGVHRPFCMDQRRAHDGTLEFTSRDAHMGAHARRSDLECLGYNLIFWSQGYLPWKENAIQQQRENVHGMKEYLMTDVKEMLKQIYGKTVPKYLGEYMHYVGKLSYQERPNYEKCKRIFQTEYLRLITSTTNSTTSTSSSLSKLNLNNLEMTLNVSELIKNSIDIKEECENNNLFEMKNSVKMIMKNLGVTPFRENGFFTTLNTSTNHSSNRVSPKNLRSKSDRLSSMNKKGKNSKSKKFSWADILSQDPDQIARERAEKEFEREETIIDSTPTRYKGNPTYAILEIQNRVKFKDRLQDISSTSFNDSTLKDTNNDSIRELQMKGFTRPMIDIIMKKRKSSLFNSTTDNTNLNISISTSTTTASTPIVGNGGGGKNQQRNSVTTEEQIRKVSKHLQRSRSKLGLRTVITPTKRGLDYKHSLIQRRNKRDINGFNKNSFVNGSNGNGNSNYTSSSNLMTDEELSSCSSMNSVASSSNLSNPNSKKNSKKTIAVSSSVAPSISSSTRSLSIQGDASSNDDAIELSDNDDVDEKEENDDVEREDEHEEKQNEINENDKKEEKESEHDYQILKTIIRKTKKTNHNHQNQNHYHNQVSSSSNSSSNKKTQKKNKDRTAISVTLNGGKSSIEVSSKRKGRKRTKSNGDSKKKRQGKKRKTKSKSPSSSSSKKKKKTAKEKTKRKISKKQKYSNDISYHVMEEEEENEDENVSFFIKENELAIRETEIVDNEENEVEEEKDNDDDDGYNDDQDDEDAQQEDEEEDDDDYDDNVSSDYEYYSVQKTNGNNCNNGHHIPVATFRKRLKRTRSG